MLQAYKSDIAMEPIALRGYHVLVHTYQAKYFRKVTFFEAIPPTQMVNVGAIAAGTQSAKTPILNLDLADNEFGQWRWYPLDNVQVRLFLPNGVGKWQLKNLQAGVDRSIMYRDPTLVSTEFCSWQDQRPSVECVNFSDYALLASRIVFKGYRFVTEGVDAPTVDKLINGVLPYTNVQCAGVASGS